MDASLLVSLGSILVAGGAAWGGARAALNGTRARVADLQRLMTDHCKTDAENQADTIDRLARIETKLETRL